MDRLKKLTIFSLAWLLLACGQVEPEQVAIATDTPQPRFCPR
jgi:hypothetical protein